VRVLFDGYYPYLLFLCFLSLSPDKKTSDKALHALFLLRCAFSENPMPETLPQTRFISRHICERSTAISALYMRDCRAAFAMTPHYRTLAKMTGMETVSTLRQTEYNLILAQAYLQFN